MNIAIAFFSGCVTFVFMMIVKMPIKILTRLIADNIQPDKEDSDVLYRRLNSVIILAVILVAVLCSYMLYGILGIQHFKMCYALKAGTISIALYALYEQWFGEE